MKKKFLSTLFFSMIVCGLLMGRTDASDLSLHYTVSGDSTEIIIPADIEGTEIQWCLDCTIETLSPSNTGCNLIPNNLLSCVHDYDNPGPHYVNFDGHNKEFENLYLSGGIQKINTFNNISGVTNFYIRNIDVSDFNFDAFRSNSTRPINRYLDNNNIKSLSKNGSFPNIFSGRLNMHLENNSLTKIPRLVWAIHRELILSENVKWSDYPNDAVNDITGSIYLLGNPIKDVKVIGGSRGNFSYAGDRIYWERVGYDYDNENPTYNYKILKDGIEVENTAGTTTDNSCDIYAPIEPGEYTFKICIDGDDECENESYEDANYFKQYFRVDYNEEIIINSPEENDIIYTGLNNIIWSWGTSGDSTEFLSGNIYDYAIYYDNNSGSGTLMSGFINSNDTDESCGYQNCASIDIGNLIETNLGGNDLNGKYELSVYLHYQDGSQVHKSYLSTVGEHRIFYIDMQPTSLNIIKPINNVYNGSGVTGLNIPFEWTGSSSNFGHYHYAINRNSEVIMSGDVYSGDLNEDLGYSFTGFLGHGSYILNVEMFDSNNVSITGVSRNFGVNIAPTLNFISPETDNYNFTGNNVVIEWTGFAPFDFYYEYVVEQIGIGASHVDNTGATSANLNLNEGDYKFTLIMHYTEGTEPKVLSGVRYFTVDIPDGPEPQHPARIEITHPTSGSTITSSSATFKRTGYNNVITRFEYSLVKSGENMDAIYITTGTSFTRNSLKNGSYSLTVQLLSGTSPVASDTINFTVSIRNNGGGGGGGGGGSSSTKSSTTNNNNLSLSIDNKHPNTNERIKIIIDTDEKYTGKVDFTKIQYYSHGNWINISVTSGNYVSNYSDEIEDGYVKFSSSDKGKMELSKFIKLSKDGSYRIYAEDKNGYTDYVEFDVGKGVKETYDIEYDIEDEVYVSRSCKKYTIKYNEDLGVFWSPDLLKNEYFINKDYFKRYIDSKNRQIDGCPTNVGWISIGYKDTSENSDEYIAPNGKVYFILGKGGNYYSNELNYELKAPKSFYTIQELKYYIRDRNPLISMVNNGKDTNNSPSNGFTEEFNNAYNFAYKNGITTIGSIEKANMNGTLTRIAMAKMLSNYAINVLGKKKINEDIPHFSDVSEGLNNNYGGAVTLAYQLGIMGQNMPDNRFRPNDTVTRAEFATALSRILYSTADGNPYYSTHIQKLYNNGIINNTNPNMNELRGYVMLMLMRSTKN